MDDRARAEEQQRLEQRVIPHVEQRAGESEHDQVLAVERATQQRDAEPERDDADVLDGVIREQALEIVLRDREPDAEHRGDRADDDQRDAPPHRWVGAHAGDPHDAVDADLDQHARHLR